MREIKFRGKDYNNKWRYGDLVQEKWGQGKVIMIKKDKTAWSVLEETIGQYTGLKDKNGKEIYEGDIIKCSFYPDFIFEIKFTELCWYMRKIPISEHIKLSEVLYEELEVIGNIYDNTELFEEGDSNV